MENVWIEILISLIPTVVFIGLMIFVYIKGTKTNKRLLIQLEDMIEEGLNPYVKEDIHRVKIRPDEYEYRCKAKDNRIRIFTVHLKLANRSFIITWLINLFWKEKERLFLGVKFGGEYGDEDPAYRFDVVPYRKKGYIRQRYETFVQYDDIPTADKRVDKKFMIKSEASAYVQHFVSNKEFTRLMLEVEPYLEAIKLQKAKEETDPHLSATFEFIATEAQPVDKFIKLFMFIVNQHLSHQEEVKKIIAKGSKGKAKLSKRGSAARGVGKKKKRK